MGLSMDIRGNCIVPLGYGKFVRSDKVIALDMVETSRELIEAGAALELLKDIYDDIRQVGPMLRKSIKKESQLDLIKVSEKSKIYLNMRSRPILTTDVYFMERGGPTATA